MKYNEMIIHHASSIPKTATQNTDKAIKQYLTLLSFQPHCLNLSANIGISDISK
jgi:homospermidine synthase